MKIHKPLLPHTTGDREKVETTIEAPQAILVISIIPSDFISVSIHARDKDIHSICIYIHYIYILSVYKSIFFYGFS